MAWATVATIAAAVISAGSAAKNASDTRKFSRKQVKEQNKLADDKQRANVRMEKEAAQRVRTEKLTAEAGAKSIKGQQLRTQGIAQAPSVDVAALGSTPKNKARASLDKGSLR